MDIDFSEVETLLEERIGEQRKKLLKIAREISGKDLSLDDIMSPHDLPELKRSSRFHFEDGILAGLLSAQMALRNKVRREET